MKREKLIALRKLSQELVLLTPSEQLYLLKLYLGGIKGDQEFLGRVAHLVGKSWYKGDRIERWMEGYLRRQKGEVLIKPKDLAEICCRKMRVNRELMPWLIRLGRRVKARYLYGLRVKGSMMGMADVNGDEVEGVTDEEISGQGQFEFSEGDMRGYRNGGYRQIRVRGLIFPSFTLIPSWSETRERIRFQAGSYGFRISEERLVSEDEVVRLKVIIPWGEPEILIRLTRGADGGFTYEEYLSTRVNNLVKYGIGVEVLGFQLVTVDMGNQNGGEHGWKEHSGRVGGWVYFLFQFPGVEGIRVLGFSASKGVWESFYRMGEELRGLGYGVREVSRHRLYRSSLELERATEFSYDGVVVARFFRGGSSNRSFGVDLVHRVD